MDDDNTAEYRQALKIDPNNVNANFGYGKVLHSTSEDLALPLQYYQKAVSLDPKHYKALCQIGIVHLEKSEFDKAADFLKQCLKLNPKYVLGLVSMGNLLFETGNAKSAARYHQQALQYNKKEIQALIGLGNSLYEIGVIPSIPTL